MIKLKSLLTESDLKRIVKRVLNEETKKIVIPEIKGLVKQKQGDIVYLSLLHNDGKKRLFFITVRPSNEQYEVNVASVHQPFFPLVKEIFNLIKKIDTTEKYSGQDSYEQDTDMAYCDFKMDSETLNKVTKTLSSSVPSLLSKYKAEKIKKKTK